MFKILSITKSYTKLQTFKRILFQGYKTSDEFAQFLYVGAISSKDFYATFAYRFASKSYSN